MARMVRKQIVLDPELERELERKAEELGVSQSEVVRRALSGFFGDDERKKRMTAWREAREISNAAAVRGVGSGGRRFTREEMNERPRRH